MNEQKTLKLRVKPVKPLPHIMTILVDGVQTTFTFTPECDKPLPLERAEALLKSYPNLFELAQGPWDKTAYKMRTSFKKETLVNKIEQLTDAELLPVYEFIEELIGNRGKGKPGADDQDEGKSLKRMNREELLQVADQMKLEVPEGATKAQIIELIESADDQAGS